jgi:hypothetical protein
MIAGFEALHLGVGGELTVTLYGLRQTLATRLTSRRNEDNIGCEKCFQIVEATLQPAPVQRIGEGNKIGGFHHKVHSGELPSH